jgi:hypothetical protein
VRSSGASSWCFPQLHFRLRWADTRLGLVHSLAASYVGPRIWLGLPMAGVESAACRLSWRLGSAQAAHLACACQESMAGSALAAAHGCLACAGVESAWRGAVLGVRGRGVGGVPPVLAARLGTGGATNAWLRVPLMLPLNPARLDLTVMRGWQANVVRPGVDGWLGVAAAWRRRTGLLGVRGR